MDRSTYIDNMPVEEAKTKYFEGLNIQDHFEELAPADALNRVTYDSDKIHYLHILLIYSIKIIMCIKKVCRVKRPDTPHIILPLYIRPTFLLLF